MRDIEQRRAYIKEYSKRYVKSRYHHDPVYREKVKKYARNYYWQHRDKIIKNVAERAKKRPAYGGHTQKYLNKLRDRIFSILGDKCSKCGFSDKRALQIDHVNGGGRKERSSLTTLRYYRHILEKLMAGSRDYQLLCANCNWIKRAENKEVGKYR